jgi:hypothetical protein
LEPCLGQLGPSWSHLGVTLPYVRAMLGHLGTILGLYCAILEPCGAYVGPY